MPVVVAFGRSRRMAKAIRFPTRQYPYRLQNSSDLLGQSTEPFSNIPEGSVVRFFLGLDDIPLVLQSADIEENLHDPFARIVLVPGHRPKSLSAVVSALNSASGRD